MQIRIKVHPNSKKEKIEKISEHKMEIWVREKAERNLANQRVIELISQYLKIPLNKARITVGHNRPNKTIDVDK